jgi:hypothetical protein
VIYRVSIVQGTAILLLTIALMFCYTSECYSNQGRRSVRIRGALALNIRGGVEYIVNPQQIGGASNLDEVLTHEFRHQSHQASNTLTV